MALPNLIDLFKGWPATHLLPTEHFRKVAAQVLSDPTILEESFGYGPDEGYYPLRKNIGKWLSEFYSSPTETEQICITGGASQNVASVLQVFTDPASTELIWFAESSYHLAFRIFEDAGFYKKMRSVSEDQEGMDVDALRNALETFCSSQSTEVLPNRPTKSQDSWRKTYKHVIYCVPSFSNPSGKTMSLQRREELIRVAREYDALIICDDVYDMLCWALGPMSESTRVQDSLNRLVDIECTLDDGPIDRFGNVVSNGSFSKLIGPGCRVGWAQGTKAFICGLSQAGQTRSGGAPSQLTSTMVNKFFDGDFLQNYIAKGLVPKCVNRYSVMVSAIERCLGPFGVAYNPDAQFSNIAGGYYIWLKLPGSLRAADVCEKALEAQNLILGCGDLFELPRSTSKGDGHQRLRLCFMYEDEDLLVAGVERLAIVIKGMMLIN